MLPVLMELTPDVECNGSINCQEKGNSIYTSSSKLKKVRLAGKVASSLKSPLHSVTEISWRTFFVYIQKKDVEMSAIFPSSHNCNLLFPWIPASS